jgi:hypothetical protein
MLQLIKIKQQQLLLLRKTSDLISDPVGDSSEEEFTEGSEETTEEAES